MTHRRPSSFKQHDITRALRATRAAGVEAARVEIDRTGKIVIVTGAAEQRLTEDEVLDRELADFEASRDGRD